MQAAGLPGVWPVAGILALYFSPQREQVYSITPSPVQQGSEIMVPIQSCPRGETKRTEKLSPQLVQT